MIRKWEWIREYCKRQGFEKSAEIADQIDRVLCYLYGGVDTKDWRYIINNEVDGIKESGEIDIDDGDVQIRVVGSGRFCVACAWNECDDCGFGRLTGVCNDWSSLFMEFINKYREESE